MTIDEFKAFIDGMDISDGGCPTVRQWARIKERLEKVSQNPNFDWAKYIRQLDKYPYKIDIGTAVPFYNAS